MMSLNKILGDTDVSRQLMALISSNRLPHAIVLECGNKKIGISAAIEICKSCVCTNTTARPCGVCNSCRKVAEGIHPDVYTVRILDKKQAIGVGEIRLMISDCYVKPNESPCKVYLIFEKMTAEAQNALLKILEEPPQNVRFIIVTESASGLLQTVISRSAVFKLDDGAKPVDDSAAEEIAVLIAKAIPENMELPLLIATGKLGSDKALTIKVLDRLAEILNLALEQKYIPSGNPPQYVSEIARTLRKLSIVRLLEVVSQARTMVLQNCNMNLLITWLCAGIRKSRHNG